MKRGGSEACSASAIIVAAASGYHLLKIDGYSGTLDVPNGSCITSCSFTIGGRSWSIDYYPNGDTDYQDYISLYLRLQGNLAIAVNGKFKFSLLDKTGKLTCTTQPLQYSVKDTRGFPAFIKRKALEASGCLENDAFTIRCDITVFEKFRAEDAEVPAPPSAVVPPPDLTKHFGDLLLSGEAADVSFSVGGETVAAHRCVLAARSPVFKAGLLGAMKESTTVDPIRIKEMEADAFRAMLHFIYTDSLKKPATTEEEDDLATFFQHLLAAADRYDIPRLKLTCESKLCEHVDIKTVAIMVALAEQHHCHDLRKTCLEFLSSPVNLKQFMATSGFQHLDSSCLMELVAKLVD